MKTRKNKIAKILKAGLLCFSISLLLWSCENEEDIKIEDQTLDNFLYKTVSFDEISNFKKSYNFASKSSRKDKLNLKLDFSKIQKQKIKNTNELTTIIPAKTKYKNITSKVILISQNNNTIKVLISLIPDKNTSSENFTGILSINDLNGDFINGYRLKNGLFKTRFIKRIKKKSTLQFRKPEPDCDENAAPDIFCDNELDEVIIGGSGSSSNYTITTPIPTGPSAYSYSFSSSSNSNYGGSSSNHQSANYNNYVNVFPCNDSVHGCQKTPCDDGNGYQDYYGNCLENDDKIINKLTGKADCVYGKLKEMSNTIFNDIINNHFGSSKKSHVKFIIKKTPNGEDAFTKGSANGQSFRLYEIQLDPTVVSNASSIEIATILIHESIHAELLDRCVRLGIINAFDSKGNPNFTNTSIVYNAKDELFAKLVYQYKNYNGGNSQWNHDLFTVTNYKTKMALNLVNIHSKLNDPNNDFLSNVNNDFKNVYGNFTIQQLMNYISWIGLEGTQEYINNIQNNITKKAKKDYIEGIARTKYTNTCN
ncbi:hypothetical protein [Tenacibaculum finnmarkense]|uniref:hypothetical protein n=1 Tax=Tenacibaculum finnmarkense TaxID=2781243 RepID=UPI001EFA4CF9|nr:hypothetical protein [Tenacibaculum finnmarkense]MCG8235125.1 hypothetical protein [Tenacibaculum finnmarkense genomovar ulcerans]MCG8829257.1 hypothetical protein [Tenacibaculum finnmarkense]